MRALCIVVRTAELIEGATGRCTAVGDDEILSSLPAMHLSSNGNTTCASVWQSGVIWQAFVRDGMIASLLACCIDSFANSSKTVLRHLL